MSIKVIKKCHNSNCSLYNKEVESGEGSIEKSGFKYSKMVICEECFSMTEKVKTIEEKIPINRDKGELTRDEVFKDYNSSSSFIDEGKYLTIIKYNSGKEVTYLNTEGGYFKEIEYEKSKEILCGIVRNPKDRSRNYYGIKNSLTGRWD